MSTKQTRVLVVDDDPLVAETLMVIFQRHGFDGVSANDADAALREVRRQAPDLVVCDIDMPGRDGISLMMDVTHELPDCPILVLTGFYSSLNRVQEYTNTLRQQVSVVTKPCRPLDLLKHARKLLKTA